MRSPKNLLILGIVFMLVIASFTGCAGNKAKLAQEEAQRLEEQRITEEKQAQEKAEADRIAKVQEEKIAEQKRIEAARLEEQRIEAERKEQQDKASLKTIHFSYDKSELNASERSILQANAELLMSYKKWNFIIEGHCDQRGSTEYNLALGERRSATVRQYYIDYGISSDRIKLVSYGEEKPVDTASNEEAYAKNRRAETIVR